MNLSSLALRVQAIIFLSLFSEQAVAYSSGAGTCGSGTAISGGHGSAGNAGSLLTGNNRLFIDGAPLDPGTSVVLTPGKDYTISLQSSTANSNGTFKGFFFRLSGKAGENVKSSIKLSPNYASIGHDNFRCASLPVGGITHNTRIEKEAVAVVVNSNDPIDMLLEVTVVKSKSIPNAWHFDSYNIRFEAVAKESAPIGVPTSLPSTSPTIAKSATSLTPSITVAPSSSASVPPSTNPTSSVSPSVSRSGRPSMISSLKPSIAVSKTPAESDPSSMPSPESPGNLTLENGDATNNSFSVRFHWKYALICAAMLAFI